jgi:hypothetical protein
VIGFRASILLGAALLLSPAHAAEPAAAPAQLDPAALDKARQLVTLTLPPEQRDAMFEKAVTAMMNNLLGGMLQNNVELREAFDEAPELRSVFTTFIERQRKMALADIKETTPELMSAYANAYARTFTASEIDDISAFLKTPTGTKYAARAADLLSDPDFAEWQRHVAAKAQDRQKDELKKLMDEVTPILAARGAKQHGS